MHRHKLWNQKKEFGHVFLFVHIDTWMIPKRIESICNLVISCNEISITTMASRYFQIWSNIEQNYKKFLLRSDRLKLFFLKLFSLELYRRKLFFFFRLVFFLEFVFILSAEIGFVLFQKLLLFLMSLVLILLKKFLFLLLIKFTQRLRCLLHASLTISLFEFKFFFSDISTS